MRPRALLVVVPALAVLHAAGCGDVVSQPIGAGPLADASAPEGALVDSFVPEADSPAPPVDAATFCSGHGPIPLPGRNECLGDLANVFRFAACACTSLDISGKLTTDSLVLANDAGAGSGDLGSVASNGELSTNATTDVGGSVFAAAPGAQTGKAVTLRGGGLVHKDVRAGGPFEVGGGYTVEGDVWANGDVTLDTGASLDVLGTIHVPQGASTTGVTGTVATGPVSVAPPCDCAHPIDVGAVVSAFAGDNDDASLGLQASSSLGGTVSLPCGRYYVAGIAGPTVTLQVQGRVALLVTGDVAVTQSMSITLTPTGELDLFVQGNFGVMGNLSIGDAGSAARTRIYVGGSSVSLSANAAPLAADLYAPNAILQFATVFQMWGALFAQAMQFSGDFTVHYDPSILSVPPSSGCKVPGGPCSSCSDCASSTPACKGGTCGPCTQNADCCAPLVCASNGQCVLSTQ